MSPEVLILHVGEDGLSVSLRPRRTSTNTVWPLRLVVPHGALYSSVRAASQHYFGPVPRGFDGLEMEDLLSNGVGAENGLTSSEPPMKRRRIRGCEAGSSSASENLTPLVMDVIEGHISGEIAVSGSRSALPLVFPIKFQSSALPTKRQRIRVGYEHQTPLVIDLTEGERYIDISVEFRVSKSRPASPLAFPIKVQPRLFSGGIKSNFEYNSTEGQHMRREHCNWEAVVGTPVQHSVPHTCALDAAAMCVEARHRRVYEGLHGRGSFPCRAAAPRELRRSCERKKLWKRGYGADAMGPVLEQVKELGGIRTTNAPPPFPCRLPLRSWEVFLPDGFNGFFTDDRLMELIDEYGPCIGVIPFRSWYKDVDADKDDNKVYRSDVKPAIDEDVMTNIIAAVISLLENDRHAAVCCRYRNRESGLDILMVDNKRRWVQSKDFLEIYTLQVDPMDPTLFRGRHIRYPLTGA